MSERRRIFGGEPISTYVSALLKSVGSASRPVLAALGVLCGTLLVLTVFAASAQERVPLVRRPATLRQFQRAETIYRIDNPVWLEETTVRVELRSAEDTGWRLGLSPGRLAMELKGKGLAAVLESLKEFGETTVLHAGVCALSGKEATSIYSTKRVPAATTRMSGGKTVSVVEYRDLGRKLTAHLEGKDAQERICFSYDIDLNYIEGEVGKDNPTFASFTATGHAKVPDGLPLVIQNFDGSTGLLIFLTPRIAK